MTESTGQRRWTFGKIALWTLGGVIVLAALFVGSSLLTDQPFFCGACHEMRPYVAAYRAGQHAEETGCVGCHVEPGVVARLEHKPSTWTEIKAHFTGDYGFPLAAPADVPDSRCIRCHENVRARDMPVSFSHAKHAEKDTCTGCHASTGHAVTPAALKKEGVLNQANLDNRARSITGTATAAADAGVHNVESHVRVGCQRCHDMKKTDCVTCHPRPTGRPHVPGQDECALCHPGGKKWSFKHPDRGDCDTCHAPEPGHFAKNCDDCHTAAVPWTKATFKHPAVPGNEQHSFRSFPCISCHPKGLGVIGCTCHQEGIPQGD